MCRKLVKSLNSSAARAGCSRREGPSGPGRNWKPSMVTRGAEVVAVLTEGQSSNP